LKLGSAQKRNSGTNHPKTNLDSPPPSVLKARLENSEVLTKLFQFTKICRSPRLTVMFSGIKICVSSSIPIRQCPQLVLIKSNTCLVFVSTLCS
jgi:hypothetical protein